FWLHIAMTWAGPWCSSAGGSGISRYGRPVGPSLGAFLSPPPFLPLLSLLLAPLGVDRVDRSYRPISSPVSTATLVWSERSEACRTGCWEVDMRRKLLVQPGSRQPIAVRRTAATRPAENMPPNYSPRARG